MIHGFALNGMVKIPIRFCAPARQGENLFDLYSLMYSLLYSLVLVGADCPDPLGQLALIHWGRLP